MAGETTIAVIGTHDSCDIRVSGSELHRRIDAADL